MISSTLRGTIIAAALCTISTMNSAVAQNQGPFGSNAEPRNSSWSLFSCANQNTMGAIAGTSFTAHYKMNGATEQTAQGWAEGVFGRSTSAAKRAAPYFYKAAKSRTLKAAALAFIPAGGIFAYEWVTCPK